MRKDTMFEHGYFQCEPLVTDTEYKGLGWEHGILKPMVKQHTRIGSGFGVCRIEEVMR